MPTISDPVIALSDSEQIDEHTDVSGSYFSQNAHQAIWKGLNVVTSASVTSFAVVLAQSPFKTILLSINKDGTLLPYISGGSLSVCRFLYRGTSVSLLGSLFRTTWFTGTKSNSDDQLSTIPLKIRFEYVMVMSLGDILVTQIHESLSQLKKIDQMLPADFKWKTRHNMWHLMSGGFAPRYLSGMISFTAICLLEDKLARCISVSRRADVNHLVAGALSGMIAAFCSYPFSSLKDTILLQSRVHDGQLITQSTISVMKMIWQDYQKNPHKMMDEIWQKGKMALPARMALSGLVFSIIAFTGETLGKEPLKSIQSCYNQHQRYGFFSPLKTTPKKHADCLQEVPMPELFL